MAITSESREKLTAEINHRGTCISIKDRAVTFHPPILTVPPLHADTRIKKHQGRLEENIYFNI